MILRCSFMHMQTSPEDIQWPLGHACITNLFMQILCNLASNHSKQVCFDIC